MIQQRIPDPGALGDSTRRKRLPAIWHLQHRDGRPHAFHLVGLARRDWDDDLLRQSFDGLLAAAWRKRAPR